MRWQLVYLRDKAKYYYCYNHSVVRGYQVRYSDLSDENTLTKSESKSIWSYVRVSGNRVASIAIARNDTKVYNLGV